MKKSIDLSIIIVSYNTKGFLASCIKSVIKYTKKVRYEIILIDNNSMDGSVEKIKKIKNQKNKLHLIQNKENVGFGQANNQGMRIAKGRYILLLNSDTELCEDSLSKMVVWMNKHPNYGISTCRLLNPDGTNQATGGWFPSLSRVFLWATFLDDLPALDRLFGIYHPNPKSSIYNSTHQQDWVTGAFLLMRREVFEKIGNFSKDFFMYVEEIDYCFRAVKRGWQIWYTPDTAIVHIGGASSSGEIIKFQGAVGRPPSILGEFAGLKVFYHKHYPFWHYPMLLLLLKIAAILRIVVLGLFGRQPQAIKTYAKAFVMA